MRQGHWVILDELNLAPTEVLEALNRVRHAELCYRSDVAPPAILFTTVCYCWLVLFPAPQKVVWHLRESYSGFLSNETNLHPI